VDRQNLRTAELELLLKVLSSLLCANLQYLVMNEVYHLIRPALSRSLLLPSKQLQGHKLGKYPESAHLIGMAMEL